MDISIIIVNYKSKKKTASCVDSVLSSDLGGINYEIIVVDNNSKDGIKDLLSKKYPQVVFLQSNKNLGMGGGNNLGINVSKGEFVLILNPDTLVANNSIRLLYNFIKNNLEIGIVGPKLLNPDGTLQYSCLRFPHLMTPIFRRTFLGKFAKKHLDKFLMKEFDHNSVKDADWILGSCLMIRNKILKEITSGFDKRFFMYFEDTDLCRRVKDAGFRVVYFPKVTVIHDHMRDSAKKVWYLGIIQNKMARVHIQSWIKYFLKWGI